MPRQKLPIGTCKCQGSGIKCQVSSVRCHELKTQVKFMEKKGYKKLKVYDEAHKLVKSVYKITEQFPKSEIFGLISQMRRAAVSVAANIIEGHTRPSKKDFSHFLSIANGSLAELEYYLELSLELNYIHQKQYDEINIQRILVGSLLGGFIKFLKT